MTGTTPLYRIPYPDGTTKAYRLGDELAAMAAGTEAALIAAGVPAATNPDRIAAPSAAARDTHFGVPSTEAARLALQARGAEATRTDLGWTERYFATYNAATNPSGMTPAGWYQVDGSHRGRTQGALAGVAPPVGTRLIEHTGSATVSTNASGDASLVLPAAFPNGLVSVHLDRWNYSNYGNTTHILAGVQSLSQVNFRVYIPAAGVLANAAGVPYIYTAKGW